MDAQAGQRGTDGCNGLVRRRLWDAGSCVGMVVHDVGCMRLDSAQVILWAKRQAATGRCRTQPASKPASRTAAQPPRHPAVQPASQPAVHPPSSHPAGPRQHRQHRIPANIPFFRTLFVKTQECRFLQTRAMEFEIGQNLRFLD